jgi:hypothetical protein
MFIDRKEQQFTPYNAIPSSTLSALKESVALGYKSGHHPRHIPAELFAGALISHDPNLAKTLQPFRLTPDLFYQIAPTLPSREVDYPSYWLELTLSDSKHKRPDFLLPATVFGTMLRHENSGVGAVIQLRSSIGHHDQQMLDYSEAHVLKAIDQLTQEQIEERMSQMAKESASVSQFPSIIRKLMEIFSKQPNLPTPARAA